MEQPRKVFLWFPRWIKTVEYQRYAGGNCESRLAWFCFAFSYRGELLDLNYKLHVSLPEGVSFPGLELDPFAVGYRRPNG